MISIFIRREESQRQALTKGRQCGDTGRRPYDHRSSDWSCAATRQGLLVAPEAKRKVWDASPPRPLGRAWAC